MQPRPRSRTSARGLLAGLGALAISASSLACGGDEEEPAATSATTTATEPASAGAGAVEMFDFGFDPNTTTIGVGDSIEWQNTGETLHNVKGKGFFSEGMEPGDTFEHEFAKEGVYDYLCTLHPDTMKGTVVVE